MVQSPFSMQMVLDQHHCWFWNNIPANQSDLREKFTVYVFQPVLGASTLVW